jgi:hypothetical protein
MKCHANQKFLKAGLFTMSLTHVAATHAIPRLTSMMRALLIGALFLILSAGWHSASAKEEVDFSNYDVPVYEQIISRIKDKVTARLGNGPNKRDRFFIIPFAYENDGNQPEFSHSFITVIRVLADGRQPTRDSEVRVGTFKRWKFEAFTISWIPHDFLENPHLCVFKSFGARVFPKLNKCPLSVGKNFSLEETIKMATNAKVVVGMWGPYEVTKEGFDLGIKRKKLLETGTIKYRADDRLYRKNRVAINCFHAMGSLDELFPNGGAFGTGFKMWGLNGTTRVLIEYTTKAGNKGLLLEPVDVKKDRYGFVYALARDEQHVFNPFKKASAYRR